MVHKIAISEEAEDDLHHAFLWYEEKKVGLGDEFLIEVDISLSIIKANPLNYGFRWRHVRGIKMKRFPYIVLYVVSADLINIISVFHSHRKPFF